MKIFFAVVIFTISLSSCITDSHDDNNYIGIGETTIQLVITNVYTPKGLMLFHNKTLPVNQSVRDLIIESDTIINISLPLSHPIYGYLTENNSHISFFSIPNDTLQINIRYEDDKPLRELVLFKGQTGDISNYLTKNRSYWAKGPDKKQSEKEYNDQVDAFFDNEEIILDSVSVESQLPKWFVDIEKERVHCQRQSNKLKQFNQRYWMHNQIISESKKLPKDIKLSNLNNYWLYEYFELLSLFRQDKYDTLLMPQHITEKIYYEYTRNNIDSVKDKISRTALSYFVSSKLSRIIRSNIKLEMYSSDFMNRSEWIEDVINENKRFISDTSIFNVLVSIKEETFERYLNHKVLNIGDPAPKFSMLDIKENNSKLSDFKGKVVLLNFWGTYCKPCIESIPQKNDLYEKFSAKDFVILNICLNSDYEGWQQIINRTDFKGRHFICRGNWQEILETNYNISNIPHYVLIDKNGNIAKTDLKDSLEMHIHETLALKDSFSK